MSYGTAWEQAQMMNFFSDHVHAPVRTIVVGIDMDWCSPATPLARLTNHPFPPWEYDDDPWNDYAHLLNTRALLHSVREVLTLAHVAPPEFQDDGYYRFTPDDSRYDPARAHAAIYGQTAPANGADTELPPVGPRPPDWTFPDLALLAQALDRFPAHDEKNPGVRAAAHLDPARSRGSGRSSPIARRRSSTSPKRGRNVGVIDFMRPSLLTRNDERLLGFGALPRQPRFARSSRRSAARSWTVTIPARCLRCCGDHGDAGNWRWQKNPLSH